MYLAVPVLLYVSERILRLFRSHDAVRIQKVPTIPFLWFWIQFFNLHMMRTKQSSVSRCAVCYTPFHPRCAIHPSTQVLWSTRISVSIFFHSTKIPTYSVVFSFYLFMRSHFESFGFLFWLLILCPLNRLQYIQGMFWLSICPSHLDSGTGVGSISS
jgi:hypothetical protein